uniref:Uncharacterized protein n=1 Tax=Anguilla anguilla TaxID=7936 RepID=A0A0E9TJN3_ANGAN
MCFGGGGGSKGTSYHVHQPGF